MHDFQTDLSQGRRMQLLHLFRILDGHQRSGLEELFEFDSDSNQHVMARNGFCNGSSFLWGVNQVEGRGDEYNQYISQICQYSREKLGDMISKHNEYIAFGEYCRREKQDGSISEEDLLDIEKTHPFFDRRKVSIYAHSDSDDNSDYIGALYQGHKEYLMLLKHYSQVMAYYRPHIVVSEYSQTDNVKLYNDIEGPTQGDSSSADLAGETFKPLETIMSFSAIMSKDQFHKAFQAVCSNEHTYLIQLSTDCHATMAFISNNGITYYNDNTPEGAQNYTSVDDFIQEFIESHEYESEEHIPVSMRVISSNPALKTSIPSAPEILDLCEISADQTYDSIIHSKSISQMQLASVANDAASTQWFIQHADNIPYNNHYSIKDEYVLLGKEVPTQVVLEFLKKLSFEHTNMSEHDVQQARKEVVDEILIGACKAEHLGTLKALPVELEAFLKGPLGGYNFSRVCKDASKQTVEFLVEQGAKIQPDEFTNTSAVITAIQAGNMEVAQILIEKGANFGFTDPNVSNLLNATNNIKTIKFILNTVQYIHNGRVLPPEKQPQARAWFFDQVFTAAAHNQNLSVINEFPEEFERHLQTDAGTNSFAIACQGGNNKVVDRYLELGVNLNPTNTSANKFKVPVMEAAFQGHASLVKRLIENGANIDYRFGPDKNLSDIALERNDADTAIALWEAGIPMRFHQLRECQKILGPLLDDSDKLIAICKKNVASGNNLGFCRGLLDAVENLGLSLNDIFDGSDIFELLDMGILYEPARLIIDCAGDNIDAVLDAISDSEISIQDALDVYSMSDSLLKHETPFILAAKLNAPKAIYFLAENNVVIDNSIGINLLQNAIQNDNQELFEALLKSGVNPNGTAQMNIHETPFYSALSANNANITAMLLNNGVTVSREMLAEFKYKLPLLTPDIFEALAKTENLDAQAALYMLTNKNFQESQAHLIARMKDYEGLNPKNIKRLEQYYAEGLLNNIDNEKLEICILEWLRGSEKDIHSLISHASFKEFVDSPEMFDDCVQLGHFLADDQLENGLDFYCRFSPPLTWLEEINRSVPELFSDHDKFQELVSQLYLELSQKYIDEISITDILAKPVFEAQNKSSKSGGKQRASVLHQYESQKDNLDREKPKQSSAAEITSGKENKEPTEEDPCSEQRTHTKKNN